MYESLYGTRPEYRQKADRQKPEAEGMDRRVNWGLTPDACEVSFRGGTNVQEPNRADGCLTV